MLSTITIISIYAEIFTAGLLLGGVYGFLFRYFKERNKSDLYLAAAFFSFALYIAGAVASQIMYNLDRPLFELILMHKLIATTSLLCAMFLGLFLKEKFFNFRWLTYSLISLIGIFVVFTFLADVSLSYRSEVIEPIVQFTPRLPIKLIWVLMWGVFGLAYLFKAFRGKTEQEKKLALLGGVSALLIVFAQVMALMYANSGNIFNLLWSWGITFVGVIGLYLSCIIPPESEIARRPLSYFRTRILFKLILIFVLLLVILFEITSVFTINLSRGALSKAILAGYKERVMGVASRIDMYLSEALQSFYVRANSVQAKKGAPRESLVGFFNANPIWDSIMLVDSSGRELVKINQDQSKLIPQAEIQKALRMSNKKYISSVQNDSEGRIFTVVGYPAGGGRILLGRINLEIIQKIVEGASFGRSEGWVYVVDREGKLIAHPDKVRAKTREDFSSLSPVIQVMYGRAGGEEFANQEGDKMVGSYAPLTHFGWGVLLEEPIKESYFVIRKLETNALLFSIIGMMITVFVGVFFARGIEKSIHVVIEGTEAVKGGDLEYKIPVMSIDEVGQLAEAFNKMTYQLKETQDHLVASEKLAALGTMAAGMAHEIKNPLVSLRTFTQLFPYKWEDEEYRKKFITVLPVEIDKINKIVEHLLKFGRPSRPELTSLNINNVLAEVLELLESECKKYNVNVETKFVELPNIKGDIAQLSQAFVNIILNAIQAMSKGGSLTVKTDVGQIIKLGRVKKYGVATADGETAEISWEEGEEGKPKPVVFIEITDTGPGIPEENLRSLFDPFFTTKPMGTGMGLSITLRIIEDHKGSIKVRSQVGKGTSFIITLPQEFTPDVPKKERHPEDGMP